MNYKELTQQAIEASKPRYDEKSGGIFIPALGIIIDIEPLSKKATWYEGMALAKQAGKRLPNIDELRYIYCHKDSINDIAQEHGGTPLASDIWSSTEYLSKYAWFIDFLSGGTLNSLKKGICDFRAVSDV